MALIFYPFILIALIPALAPGPAADLAAILFTQAIEIIFNFIQHL
jgi:hypothetical protein